MRCSSLNQHPGVRNPIFCHFHSLLSDYRPESADRRRLAAIEHSWQRQFHSSWPDCDGLTVGLYVIDKSMLEQESLWLRSSYLMLVPNWWHQRTRHYNSRIPDDNSSGEMIKTHYAIAFTASTFLAIFVLRWWIASKNARSSSGVGYFGWLLVDQFARSLGLSAPTTDDGRTSALGASVALACSCWGMWNAVVLTGLRFRYAMTVDTGAEWQPVFKTLDDVRAYGSVLFFRTIEPSLFAETTRWQNEFKLVRKSEGSSTCMISI